MRRMGETMASNSVPAASAMLLTSREAAAALRLSLRSLQSLTRAGLIPAVRIGPRTIRYRREALAEWLAAKEKGGASA